MLHRSGHSRESRNQERIWRERETLERRRLSEKKRERERECEERAQIAAKAMYKPMTHRTSIEIEGVLLLLLLKEIYRSITDFQNTCLR